MPRHTGVPIEGDSPRATPPSLARRSEDFFLDVLFSRGASSRAEIARVTGISKPTISDAAGRLLKAGLVVDRGQQASERGRPVQLYDINPDYGHVVGVAIERGHVAVRALDFAGNPAYADLADTNAGDNVPAAMDRARGMLERVNLGLRTPRLATSVAVAAPVDPRTLAIIEWPASPFSGIGALAPALGMPDGDPLRIDNDVNWATLAEQRIGSMQNHSNFLYIYLGAGVGAGLFLCGRLHRGSSGMAGEIAFTRLEDGDVLIHKLTRSAIGTHDGWGGSIDVAHAMALFNGPDTRRPLEPLIDDLARAISNLAATTDPGRIVLGGPLSESQPLVDELRRRIQPIAMTDLMISTSTLGRDAPVCGAAIGALESARERRGRERLE